MGLGKRVSKGGAGLHTHISALFLIISAGLMAGSFVVPMKAARQWEFENTWLLFCFLGLVVLPSLVAILTVPHLGQVLLTSPTRSLLLVMFCGLGAGCGSVLFGLGVRELGIGLASSIGIGVSSSLGSIIPWLSSDTKSMSYSLLLWLGVLVMLSGVVICSIAARERARRFATSPAEKGNHRKLYFGLAICVSNGVLSCFQNLGIAYGSEISLQAKALGASVWAAPNVLWLIIMNCAFVTIVLFYGHLLWRNRSWQKYRTKTFQYTCVALLMALLWEGNLIAYGVGVDELGNLGPSVGWPILMSIGLVTSNLWGAATGEWRGAGRQASSTMILGLGVILIAVIIFGWASTKA